MLRAWRNTLLLAVLFATVVFPPKLSAHFKLNLNIRIIHVEHVEDGLDVYLRLPMPYVVANLLGPEQADGTRQPAPFTTNRHIDGELMHYLDIPALQQDAAPLGQLVSEGHAIHKDDITIPSLVVATRVYEGKTQPPFSTLEEAKRAFARPHTWPTTDPPPFVGDTVVDVILAYRTTTPVGSYAISSSLNPQLPGQQETANLILDYSGADQRIYRVNGLLDTPQQVIAKSAWAAARTFIEEGIRHILSGYDHLLFVACLVIGAVTLASLAWRITGFTVGHSITLSLGYFGFVPGGEWFIPLVETGIAVSIIYAALVALSGGTSAGSHQRRNQLWSTTAIGLLHGLGFGFVLQEILGLSSANIWVSLLSFNVGVEIGQLGVVLLIWPLMALLLRTSPPWHNGVKWVIAVPAIALASVWTGQRAMQLLATLG